MVQSKRLGEDVSADEWAINRYTAELKELERIYEETRNNSRCATDWQTQCEPGTIKTYQKNITSLEG